MKEDNPGPKHIKGDNSREIIICEGWWVSIVVSTFCTSEAILFHYWTNLQSHPFLQSFANKLYHMYYILFLFVFHYFDRCGFQRQRGDNNTQGIKDLYWSNTGACTRWTKSGCGREVGQFSQHSEGLLYR